MELRSLIRDFKANERGSVIVFTILVLVLMLLAGGMAVDFVRYSAAMARIQDTADRAALAATNLASNLDPEEVVETYFAAAGYADNLEAVYVEDTSEYSEEEGQEIDYRRVTVAYNFGIETLFLPFAGIDIMGGTNVSSAVQGVASLEISLVLDISASMSGSRIATLRTEASTFAGTVLDEKYEGLVSMNVVPFAGDFDVGVHMYNYLEAVHYMAGIDYLDTLVVGADTPNDISDDIQYTGVPYKDTLPYLNRLAEGADTPGDLSDDVEHIGIPYLETLIAGADTPDDRTDDIQANLGPHCVQTTNADLDSMDLPPKGRPKTADFKALKSWIRRGVEWWCPIGATVRYAQQEAGDMTDEDSLVYMLANLPMGVGTHSAPALVYGAQLLNPTTQPAFEYLSDNGAISEDFADRPAAYDDIGVQKVLIFMSDGNPWHIRYPKDPMSRRNLNIDGTGLGGIDSSTLYTQQRSNNNHGTDFDNKCAAIKAAFPDLTLITVAFEASTDAKSRLRICSSGDGSNFYDANEDSLGSVFSDIAKQVSQLRVLE